MVVNSGGVVEGVWDIECDAEVSMVEMAASMVPCAGCRMSLSDGCNVNLGGCRRRRY